MAVEKKPKIFGTGQWTHDHDLCYALAKAWFDAFFGPDERDLVIKEEGIENDPYEQYAEEIPVVLERLMSYWDERGVTVKLMDGTRIAKVTEPRYCEESK